MGWGAGDVWRGSVGGIRSITVGSEPRGVDKKGVAIIVHTEIHHDSFLLASPCVH